MTDSDEIATGDDCPKCGSEILHVTATEGALFADHKVRHRRNDVVVEDFCVLDPEDFDL